VFVLCLENRCSKPYTAAALVTLLQMGFHILANDLDTRTYRRSLTLAGKIATL